MWQKHNLINIQELEKARNQIINAIQLVSAAPRSFMKKDTVYADWLYWEKETNSFDTKSFGNKEKIKISFDFRNFILTIAGQGNHIEHLVLSGITYPMAYGWMKIKLDSFSLDGDKYNDQTPYSLENPLGADEEMNITNQNAFDELAIYYSNAFYVLEHLQKLYDLDGNIICNPEDLSISLILSDTNKGITCGFSPGNSDYIEPFYFIEVFNIQAVPSFDKGELIGIWNTKNWNGSLLLASQFITLNQEEEEKRITEFFGNNMPLLTNI